MPSRKGRNKRGAKTQVTRPQDTQARTVQTRAVAAQATPIQATPIQTAQAIKKATEPITCPADGCNWATTSRDKNRALLRHLRYIITINKGMHKMKDAHEVAQAAIQKEKECNPEKQKAAQAKYRMANRKKRSEATRLALLKKQVRKSGEINEILVAIKAKNLMEEKRRKNSVEN